MLTPDFDRLQNSTLFIKYFLKNKQKLEQQSISNINENNFIWYFNPIQNKLDWINLTELVKNIVTEDFDSLVDPIQIICGCSLIFNDAQLMTKQSAYYTSIRKRVTGNKSKYSINYMHQTDTLGIKFFQDKKRRQGDSLIPKIKKKLKSRKKSKSKKKVSKTTSRRRRKHRSVDKYSIPNLILSKTNIRAASYRIKPTKSKNKKRKKTNSKGNKIIRYIMNNSLLTI